MKKTLNILFVLAILASACTSNQKAKEAVVEKVVAKAVETVVDASPAFKSKGIQNIYSIYEQLRDALVATDFETAKSFANQLNEVLKADESTSDQATIAANISTASDIENARVAFSVLNEGMEAILTGSLEAGEINKCFCPMANDNAGAYWYSTSAEINNPYFGDKMLKCGSIKATVK